MASRNRNALPACAFCSLTTQRAAKPVEQDPGSVYQRIDLPDLAHALKEHLAERHGFAAIAENGAPLRKSNVIRSSDAGAQHLAADAIEEMFAPSHEFDGQVVVKPLPDVCDLRGDPG